MDRALMVDPQRSCDTDQRRRAADGLCVAVVIPCYKVRAKIGAVVEAVGPEVEHIICVDDACPEGSGKAIAELAERDSRVSLVKLETNRGVGGATCAGYRAALDKGAHVVVKIDGDGQMDPSLIPKFVEPIAEGEADYVKGNRFFSIDSLSKMKASRVIGNGGLSFMTKLSTGYWDLFDPANGFTAIEASVLGVLPLNKLHRRFFFESDMLFRLGTIRARVIELPIESFYADENSNLSEFRALLTFPFLHARNFFKRLLYGYFLRGFSVASLNLIFGILFLGFGIVFGTSQWIESAQTGAVASPGTVMLAGLPVLLGLQLLLSFLSYDVAMTPNTALHPKISKVQILRQHDAEKTPDPETQPEQDSQKALLPDADRTRTTKELE